MLECQRAEASCDGDWSRGWGGVWGADGQVGGKCLPSLRICWPLTSDEGCPELLKEPGRAPCAKYLEKPLKAQNVFFTLTLNALLSWVVNFVTVRFINQPSAENCMFPFTQRQGLQ